MKFYTTPYHSNLIKDIDRLSVFYEGINDYYKSILSNGNNKIQDNDKKFLLYLIWVVVLVFFLILLQNILKVF